MIALEYSLLVRFRVRLMSAGYSKRSLAAGLVNVKVAAVDATWSGLKFLYRLKDRG